MKETLRKMGVRKIVIGGKKLRRHSVACSGCAFLAFVEKMPPLCLAKADYIDGAIHRRIDLTGIAKAEDVNKKHDCPLRRGLSLRGLGLQYYLKVDCKKKGMSYGRRAAK